MNSNSFKGTRVSNALWEFGEYIIKNIFNCRVKDLEEQIHSLTNKICPATLLSKLACQILRDIDWTTAQPSRAKIILLATNLINNPVQINTIQKRLTDCQSEFYNFMEP